MKNLFIALFALLMVACTQSPEDKANALIKKELNKTLVRPETYEAVETTIDSAFSPKDDPAFVELMSDMMECYEKRTMYEDDAKEAKKLMALYSGPYQTSYGKENYNENKEKYETSISRMEEADKRAEKLAEKVKKYTEKGKTFIGFKVSHTFRAKNNNDNTLIGNYLFIMDKDFTKVLATYDKDGEDYQFMQQLFKRLSEAADE